ncbi:shikimate kinase [Verminephrobacter aporrectodeae]|uniref:shikimate kinase n=1 Tax=Verminephrobacter aporrectodeae TaxID=1110389 RepID=UPI0002377054|nr:shikimate kinase [Verminephrobacter aporrectodeae]
MQIRCALVGMPGSGKSTLGRQLAQHSGVPFIDLDQRLEQTLGCSIRSYFEVAGEACFRDLEAQALADVAQQPGGMLLSTGGGAVLRADNRDVLRRFGSVFYLHALPEEICRRVQHDRTRPLLQGGNPLKRLRALYAQRDGLYRETARHVIETGRSSVRTLVGMAALQLEQDLAADAAQRAAE